MAEPKVIELTEYQPKVLQREELAEEMGERLWRQYGDKVKVDFPSPITGWRWQLTSQGWVGFIPLTKELGFSLQPKVELGNIFRMLEYAFRLQELKLLDDLFSCQTLQEFYSQLASILAKRALDRGRKGFYREYLSLSEQLPYVSGRLEVDQVLRRPWEVRLHCLYQEHTRDIEDNQILEWTLYHIARGGLCQDAALQTVRKAFHALQGSVSLVPAVPDDCIGRMYNRLNQDYHPLHALCRFFLGNSGPTHQVGEKAMLPFLIDMAHLFELFVAEWLRAHLPPAYTIKPQERVYITSAGDLFFRIDLVIYDTSRGKTVCVLDTKYKDPYIAAPSDIAQVVAYAEAKDCHEAILVYPTKLDRPLVEYVGDIRVRTLPFELHGDLETAGHNFLKDMSLDWKC